MGLFDFMRGGMSPAAGKGFAGKFGMNPNMNPAMAPEMADPGMLMTAPTMQQQPGIMERMRQPNADGIGLQDRLMMAALALQGQGGAALQYRSGLKKQAQEKGDRSRQNEAFRGAYDPVSGKFDPAKYLEAIGDAGDATDVADLQKAFAPKTGVDGGFSYSINPTTGQVEWGDQRPMSYNEEAASERMDDNEQWRSFLRDLYERREDRMQTQGAERIGLARQREGRIAGQGAARGPATSRRTPWAE